MAIRDTLTGFFNAVQLGARIQRDRPLSERWGIYSQSVVALSFRMLTTGYGLPPFPYAFGGALEASGGGGRFIWAERLSSSFRPPNVELASDALSPISLNWNVVVGLGTVW